jgi:hypothetical protein
MLVGRVYHIEGDLLRYVPAEKDWVAVVSDAPFSIEDALFSGTRGMAELIVPNGAWMRIGNSTQIQFITLDADLAEMDVASGVARFYNKGSNTVIKVTSPFGYVLADPGTVFDFYVGDNSVEVVAMRGKVSFVHSAAEAKYDVAAGSPSILADDRQVSSGEGTVDPDWDRWNTVREDFWAAKAKVGGRSAEYLPPSLRDEAYALEENGRWERVPYEGTERWFWRPATVAVGWSPFTVGRWTDWYGEQTWIPAERFGYVTHHYGNWVYVRNYWYWAPPVVSVRVGLPLLDVGYYWCPGRVSWIHSGTYVGWVPLAPRETYYSFRNWGDPHAVVVNDVNITQINVNARDYAYVNRAIVVNQNNFYKVTNYTNVQVTNINRTTIINDYRAAPVVSNAVIANFTTNKQRYNYTNVTVNEKPHNTVLNRIQQNEAVIHEGKTEKASVLQERVKGIREGKASRETRVEQPKITNNIVPANEVNRPKVELKLQQREVKTRGKPGEQGKPIATPERAAPPRPTQQQEKPAAKPERGAPPKPTQQEKPAVAPERAAPPRPTQQEKPAAKPERGAPPKPTQQEKPIATPERAAPARPTQQQEKPAVIPERAAPPKPTQQEKPAATPERAAPPKPTQQEKPAATPERAAPPRPTQQEKPAATPERAAPPKPTQQEKPAATPERAAPPRPTQQEKPAVTPERAAPPKPTQQEKPPEKAKAKPAEKDLEKQIEKPKEPTSDKDQEKPRERKPPEKER